MPRSRLLHGLGAVVPGGGWRLMTGLPIFLKADRWSRILRRVYFLWSGAVTSDLEVDSGRRT